MPDTALNLTQGFDAFLGNFSVPHIPPRVAHILYLFTGLQNKDWCDREPELSVAWKRTHACSMIAH
jgi:hypothetical protein